MNYKDERQDRLRKLLIAAGFTILAIVGWVVFILYGSAHGWFSYI